MGKQKKQLQPRNKLLHWTCTVLVVSFWESSKIQCSELSQVQNLLPRSHFYGVSLTKHVSSFLFTDIRKIKVLIEYFDDKQKCYAIKHTQDEAGKLFAVSCFLLHFNTRICNVMRKIMAKMIMIAIKNGRIQQRKESSFNVLPNIILLDFDATYFLTKVT